MASPTSLCCRHCGQPRTSADHYAAAAAIVDEHYPRISRVLSRQVDRHLAAAELV